MRDDELRTMLYNTHSDNTSIEPGNEGIRTRLPLFVPRERDTDWREQLKSLDLWLSVHFPRIAELIRGAINIADNAGI